MHFKETELVARTAVKPCFLNCSSVTMWLSTSRMNDDYPWPASTLAMLLVLGASQQTSQSAVDRRVSRRRSRKAARRSPPRKGVEPGRHGVVGNIRGRRRRVLVEAAVCLREGLLELLMPPRHQEHEAILHSPAFAHEIHAALLAAGGKPGNLAKYSNEKPFFTLPAARPSRSPWSMKEGRRDRDHRRQGMGNANYSQGPRQGLGLSPAAAFQDPDDPKTLPYAYLANNGDVICVSNFVDAMLDLPINSPKENNELAFEAWTERIPPLNAKVTDPGTGLREKDKEKK